MIIALIMGAITPVRLCLFVVADVGGVPVRRVTAEALKYLPSMLIVLLLVILYRSWLPGYPRSY